MSMPLSLYDIETLLDHTKYECTTELEKELWGRLKGLVEEHESEMELLESERDDLEARVDELEEEVDTLNEQIVELEERIEELENEDL